MRFGAVLMGAVALLACSGAASAKVITQTFTITVKDWVPYFGSTPIDPLVGAFTVSYDPAVETDPTAVGITVNGANFPTLIAKFTYLPQFDLLDIATKPTLGGGFLTNQNGDYGFLVEVSKARLEFAQYIALDGRGEYYSQTGSVRVSGVPEPTTWLLMIAGFGLTGATFRSRRTVVAA